MHKSFTFYSLYPNYLRGICAAIVALVCGDFVLAPPSHAQPTLTGRIANARTGFGILNIDLDVFDELGNAVAISGGRSGTDGQYSLTLPGAGRFIVRADPGTADFFVDQYYNNAFLPSQATVLDIGATGSRTGINFSLNTGFLIRGTVSSSGAPVGNIDLDLYSSTGEFLSGYPAVSSTNGTFTVGALPPGQYYLRATPSAALGQFYVATFVGGAYERSAATPLTISSSDVNNVIFALTPGGTIAGRVTDSLTQAGVTAIDLDVFDAAGNLLPYSARSDSTGAFVVGPVPAGDYKVKADPTAIQNYAELYFPGTSFRSDAQLVRVEVGQATPSINFALIRAGEISGRILDAQTGVPITGVDLDVFDSAGRLLEPSVHSDASGFYRLPSIPVGFVFVRAQPALTSGHISSFYDSAGTLATATPVQIAAGQIAAVDFRLSGAGWIEGIVKNRQGSPLADIDLDLYFLPGGERAGHTTRTKLDGTFLLGPLLPGSYVLRCDPDALQGYARTYYPSTFFRPSAEAIAVNVGQGTRADFVLEAAGAISGQITDVGSSTGVAGIDLDLFDASGQELDVTGSSDGAGNYLLGPVPSGTYYLRADPGASEGRLPQYFAGATNIQNATIVSVTAGKTSGNVNFALAPAGWISGVVKNTAGVALPSIDLDLYLAETGQRVLIGTLTDTNGTFQLGPIAPGKYFVRCDPDIPQGYAVEYYSGKPNKTVANVIPVEAFVGTSNINFTLDPAGSISGRITAADTDNPLAGITINVFEAGSLARMDQITRSDAQGLFHIGPLPLGSYILSANPDPASNYVRTFFPSSVDISAAQTIILSTQGEYNGVDVRVLASAVSDLVLSVAPSGSDSLRISAIGPANGLIQLQALSALSGDSWIAIGTPTQNTSGTVTWVVPITSSNQFFKARLE